MSIKKMGLEALLAAGFGLVMVLTMVIGISSIGLIRSFKTGSVLAAADAHRALLAGRLSMLQQRGQVTSRAYFLQPSADAVKRYRESQANFEATSRELFSLTADAEQTRRLTDAKALSDQGVTLTEQMIAQEAAGHHDQVTGFTHPVGGAQQGHPRGSGWVRRRCQ